MALGAASIVVKVVAEPLLLLQKKRLPEQSKSPGQPKLAIESEMVGELDGWSVLLGFEVLRHQNMILRQKISLGTAPEVWKPGIQPNSNKKQKQKHVFVFKYMCVVS